MIIVLILLLVGSTVAYLLMRRHFAKRRRKILAAAATVRGERGGERSLRNSEAPMMKEAQVHALEIRTGTERADGFLERRRSVVDGGGKV
ncbi:hypothetical protein GGR58DRAFT_486099 [Xylaria digitata]|nr:hypothetical protein GGR58DRAFT_486099 [Xylaria digitata]